MLVKLKINILLYALLLVLYLSVFLSSSFVFYEVEVLNVIAH